MMPLTPDEIMRSEGELMPAVRGYVAVAPDGTVTIDGEIDGDHLARVAEALLHIAQRAGIPYGMSGGSAR